MPLSFRLLSATLLSAVLVSACNPAPSSEQPATATLPQVQPAAARPVVATTDTALAAQLQNPKVGDVYVVQFQPRNTTEQRYFFYQVFAVRPNEVDIHPAKKEVSDPQTDGTASAFYSADKMTYTRAEALELLQEQPGDVLHTRLIAVRR